MLSIPRRANARWGSRGSAVAAAAALVVTVIPAFALSSPSSAAAGTDSVWAPAGSRPPADADLHPSHFKGYTLDASALAERLAKAPSEDALGASGARVSMPAPSGELVDFDVVETQMLEPGLAAKHPEIKTYAGKAVESNAAIVIDVSPWGFHAAVRGSGASWFIDPAVVNDTDLYLSYRGSDLPEPEQPFVEPELDGKTVAAVNRLGEGPDQAVTRRTYRLALLTDPTYAQYVAPGLNDGAHDAESNSAVLAAKTTLMNRVNEIYTNDLAVRMVLVNDTDKLNLNTTAKATGASGACGVTQCFTVANLDPANGCLSSLLTRNRLVVGQLIGAENFDIGHIGLGINGGGIASLGVVGGNNKAQGCTGLPDPIGDFYAIDYVAHEMGHQFSGNHTFNGTQVNCSTGNRNAGTSVEPGSGSSVMAYAGICLSDDEQPHTDPYFSQRSQFEITNYLTSTLANVNEVQSVAFNGAPNAFDGTDSFTLTFPGIGTTGPITRGGNYTAVGIKAAIETLFNTVPAWASSTATVAGYFGGTFGDNGFQVTYTGTGAAGKNVPNPTLNATGFTGFASDTAQGGPANNNGAIDSPVVNHAPLVLAPAGKFIPTRTPFTLTGEGSDIDGDSLIYLWEQNDVGAAGTAGGTGLITQPKVNGPLFRVFGHYANVTDAGTLLYHSPGENLATTSPSRTFPDMDQILAGNTNAATGSCPALVPTDFENNQPTRDLTAQGFGIVPNTLKDGPALECFSEFLPTAAYNGTAAAANTEPSLNFRLTARDQNPLAGGYQYADTKLRIDKTAGPFLVTSQATPVTYASNSAQTITWDVNNTNKPTLAPNVKISFSEDGGQTFPIVLAANTPNDGSQSVTMPVSATTTGRIKIEALGNYFFDVNDASITLTKSFTVTHAVPATVPTQYSDGVGITFTASSDFGAVSVSPTGLPAGLALTKTAGTAPSVLPSTGAWSVTGTVTAPPGSYPVTFTVTDGVSTPLTITTTIVVAAEDATATYTGPATAEAPQGGNDVVNVPLSAHVVQAADGNPGDLTTATVTIKDTIANEVLCANVPVSASGDASCSYSADIPLQSGRIYNLQLQVGGRFTGTGSGSLSVTIDHSDPETSITSGPAEGGYLLATVANLGISSNEAPVTFTCTLDGGAQSCLGSPVSLSGLSAKTHQFTVFATDQAGNADETPATRTFTVPMDDAVLASTKGTWTRGSESGAFRGTVSTSKKKGSTLSSSVTGATSLSLIASTGKKGGTVKVFLNGQLLKTISLKGAAAGQVLIPVATFSSAQSGTVTIVNDTKKANKKKKQKSVVIDGLGVITAP